jgi:hypothetical protein
MKKLIAVGASCALIAGGVTAIAHTTSKDATSRCVVPKGAENLVANTDMRVYTQERASKDDSQATAIYACLFRTGKRVALGTAYVPFSDEGDGPIRYIRDISLSEDLNDPGSSPPSVAYVDTNCMKDPCTHQVVVKSLHTGKTTRRMKAGGPFDQLTLSFPTDQDGLAIAWLETSLGGNCENGCKVHLVKESGDKVVDEGTDIDSDRFGTLDTDHPGIIYSRGSNEFVWEKGGVMKVYSFND